MKRYLFTIVCLLFGLTLRSQSVYTCQYWFDQDDGQAVTATFSGDTWQAALDVGAFPDGVHTLHFHAADTSMAWSSPQSFLFFKWTPTVPSTDVVCHYWFDQEDENVQNSPFGNGFLQLDVNGLTDGMHTLHVMMEGNELASTESFLFLKLAQELPIAQVQYHYWFDWDDDDVHSGLLGNGLLQLDVNDLEEGIHTLHVMMEGNDLASTQSFMFLKMAVEEPTAELTYFYWFDEDDTNLWSGTLGDGILPMDVNGLEEGEHVLNIVIEGNDMTATQSFEFTKLLPSPCPYPDNLEAVLNDTSFISFTWTCPGDTFRFQYYTSDDPTPIIENVTGHSYVLNSPAPSIYYWSVQNICSEADTGYFLSGPSIFVPHQFHITASVYPENTGTVIGGGWYAEATEATLSAQPNEGYAFLRWTESGETVSEEADYTFTVTSSRELVAEFCRLELNNFTYMSPADGYVNHYAEADFYWDAVPDANRYDFYFWEGEDGRPDWPVATDITSTTYHVEGLEHDVTYHWCVVAKNECAEQESAVRSFTCQLTPAMSVLPVETLDFGEVEVGQNRTKVIAVSGTALSEEISYTFLNGSYGQDVDFFSITPAENWNPYKGGSLYVTFTPENTQLYYNAAIQIASGAFLDTIYCVGSLANRFVFSTDVEEEIYSANDEIAITGHVEDVLGNVVSNLDVDVYLVVMGSRITLPTISDEFGNYSVSYSPRYSEAGYYQVGSCASGDYSITVHDAFDIPGISRASSDFIIWEPYQNDTITGVIEIRNRSRIPLNNIQVVPISLPDGCNVNFTSISLGSLETGQLNYVVTGTELSTGSNYEEGTLLVTNDEGIAMYLTFYYYCHQGRGELEVYPPSFVTTMRRNVQKMLSFQITNNGTDETGPITISLPNVEWMSVLGGNTLPSVAVGDSCAFTLQLAPDENVSLIQFEGNIAVNCANGNGISVPYVIEATTDSTGTLIVDVTDDYTYNTNGGFGPHLAGAQVTVTGYYSLETVAQGLTDENGLFTVENLPEGFYVLNVQAQSHSEYNRGIIYIEAGKTNQQEIYLQFQAISYSWVVVPTDIPDVYDFELVCDIKTNVPMPVITVEGPGIIDSLAYDDSLTINITVTNHGLIDAYDAQIVMSNSSDYVFTPLFDVIDTIYAKTSVVIPCMVTRVRGDRDENVETCKSERVSVYTWWYCNRKKVWEEQHDRIRITSYAQCLNFPDGPLPYNIGEINWTPLGGPLEGSHFFPFITIGGYPFYFPHPEFDFVPFSTEPTTQSPEVATTSQDCTPCWKVGLSFLVHLATDWAPAPVSGIIDCYIYNATQSDMIHTFLLGPNPLKVLFLSKDLINCYKENIISYVVQEGLTYPLGKIGKKLGPLFGYIQGLKSVGDRLQQCVSTTNPYREIPNWINSFDQFQICIDANQSLLNELKNLFYEDEWMEEENISEFLDCFIASVDTTTYFVSSQSSLQLKEACETTHVNDSIIQRFVDRWNRSVQYWNEGILTIADLPAGYDSCFIQIDSLAFLLAQQAVETAEAYGFGSIGEMFESSYNALMDAAQEHKNDVCSKVSVQFRQTMAMTREAFEGTLKIYNGHTTDPMENIDLNMVIKNADGVDCTDLFQINVSSFDQITAIDGTGSLDAQQEAVIRLMMIPTIAAAPETPQVYSFGGSFTFLDPFSGEEMTYQLYPVELTVNPSPDLHVDYFVQRHLISDDPLTTDTIEATEPAEIAMMIRNVGAGNADNVYLESFQPTIIENQNGLLINFEIVGAAMNGEQRPLGLLDIPFGTIQSQSAGIAEWYFTSSLMARVLRSTPNVIHNDSYGNPNLSLVTELHSHELIKAITAYGSMDDGVNDFFVNETTDFNHTPDKIYFSHGGTANVKKILVANAEGVLTNENNTIVLSVNPIAVGWNYACIGDPGQGLYEIISCTRNDGQEIPLSNVWITHVTMFDDDSPIHENKLHIVDTIPVEQTTTYTLIYANEVSNLCIFNGNVDVYWSNAENWEGNIMPQAIDEVLINGICQLNEDATVASLTIAESQSLTIPEGQILTVSNNLENTTTSRLVIEDGGQLMHANAGAHATVRKAIAHYTNNNNGWYLIASPLVGNTAVTAVNNLLLNTYDLYYYDEPTYYWINQKLAENGFAEFENGTGYLYANFEEVMLEFSGELQNGVATVNVPLSYTPNIPLSGFNLVGNPYAHNVTSYATINVANGYYQTNETKDDLMVNEISEANPLKPAEGFFVKATGTGALITFNSGRGATETLSESINVEVSENGKLVDRLIVKREGEPLEKFSLNEVRTKVFAMQDNQEVAIVLCDGSEQPVGFKAAKDGTYTLNVNAVGVEFDYLHLVDNLTGTDVDLLVEPSYTFEAKTSDYASRFRLVFSICEDANGGNAPFAFINNGNIIIIGAEADAVLQIVDVLGHVVISTDVARNVSTSGMTKGVYVLRLISGDTVKTQKIVIE